MHYNRKEFLKTVASVTGACMLSPLLAQDEGVRRLKNTAIQLYTVRDIFEKDPRGVLKQLSEQGYDQVESYERSKGMFWGMEPLEFRNYLDDLGMKIVASHVDAEKDLAQKAKAAASIGMKYLLAAWEGPGKSIEDYKRLAEKYNAYARITNNEGVRFAFHNHWFSFEAQNGIFPQDVLLENTDASLVDFEMDMYWVVTAGQDPVYWLNKYPGRFRLCHIKDRTKGSTKREDTCDLGKGSIDYKTILAVARKKGMQFYFSEQEHYPESVLKTTSNNAGWLKQLRF